MVGWHHRLSGHEFEPALGDGEGQGGLVTCGPAGHKESDTAERLNNDCSTAQSPVSRQTTPSPSCEHCFVPRINEDLDLDLDSVQASWCSCRGCCWRTPPWWVAEAQDPLSCLRRVSSFGPEVPETSCSPVLRERCPPAPGLAEGEEACSLLVSGSGHAHPAAPAGAPEPGRPLGRVGLA